MDQNQPTGEFAAPERDVAQIIAALRKAQESGEPADPSLMDLKDLNFLGQNLSKLDLSGFDFSGAELSRCDLRDAICAHAKFDKATFFQAKLDGGEFLAATFQGANLTECSAKNAGFGQCDLSHANVSMATLTGSTFVGAKAVRADFRNSDLSKARFLGADLTHADFSKSLLVEVDLRQTNLNHSTFAETDLRSVQLRGAKNYATAHWIDADIRDVDFAGAYLVRRHIVDENFLHEFKQQSKTHKLLFHVWSFSSDCGRSTIRWSGCCAVIIVAFGFIFQALGEQVYYPQDLGRGYAPWYFSVMLFCCMALGDVLPKSTLAQLLVNTEVVIGYIGFGGLLTIISTQMGTRGE